jgi:hypothetical protein
MNRLCRLWKPTPGTRTGSHRTRSLPLQARRSAEHLIGAATSQGAATHCWSSCPSPRRRPAPESRYSHRPRSKGSALATPPSSQRDTNRAMSGAMPSCPVSAATSVRAYCGNYQGFGDALAVSIFPKSPPGLHLPPEIASRIIGMTSTCVFDVSKELKPLSAIRSAKQPHIGSTESRS